MPDIFGIDVAGIVADAFRDAGELRPGVLIRATPVLDDTQPTARTAPQTTRHSFTGLVYRGNSERRPGTLILDTQRRLLIIGGSLNPAIVPQVNDTADIDGSTFTLDEEVSGDSTGAAYEFRVK